MYTLAFSAKAGDARVDLGEERKMIQQNFSSVEDVVSYVLGGRRNFNADSCVYHDLSISGDDAFDLIEKIKNSFGTKFDNFNFNSYFPEEGESIYLNFIKILGLGRKRKKMTVSHLKKVVQCGCWFEP